MTAMFPTAIEANDIFANADIVLVDAKFALDKTRMIEFRDCVLPKLHAAGKKPMLTWPMRMELYLLEKDDYSSMQHTAKWIHTQYHALHSRGLIGYGPIVEHYGTSEKDFIRIFLKNPDRRILIFTKDRDLVEDIQKCQLQNVLPVTLTGMGKIEVFTAFVGDDVVERFISPDSL